MSEENKIGLLDLAQVDLNEVEEFRFEVLPILAGYFEITETKIEEIGDKPAIVVVSKLVGIDSVTGFEGNQEDLIGKEHREAFFIKEIKDVGRFKAWVIDTGQVAFEGPVSLNDLVKNIVGLRYAGKIKHRRDKNDAERIYANVQPVPPKEEAA